jgi:hypothetical protein
MSTHAGAIYNTPPTHHERKPLKSAGQRATTRLDCRRQRTRQALMKPTPHLLENKSVLNRFERST